MNLFHLLSTPKVMTWSVLPGNMSDYENGSSLLRGANPSKPSIEFPTAVAWKRWRTQINSPPWSSMGSPVFSILSSWEVTQSGRDALFCWLLKDVFEIGWVSMLLPGFGFGNHKYVWNQLHGTIHNPFPGRLPSANMAKRCVKKVEVFRSLVVRSLFQTKTIYGNSMCFITQYWFPCLNSYSNHPLVYNF